jgi:hypothetical protein
VAALPLAAVYFTFTEGFTTPDLVDADALLKSLAGPPIFSCSQFGMPQGSPVLSAVHGRPDWRQHSWRSGTALYRRGW